MVNLFTQVQIFELGKKAGFDNANAEILSAVALAETLHMRNGIQYADMDKIGDIELQTTTWGPSYSAYQIRTLKADTGTGRIRDASRLQDPIFATNSAFQIWRTMGWSAWSTYKSNAYLGYLIKPVYNPPPVMPAPNVYMVTGGDSLSKIGYKTGYDWRLIAKINTIEYPYTIYPGQVLMLPDFEHTIKAGDTLYRLAIDNRLTVDRLISYNNNLDPNKLQIGQVIKIPRYM